MINGHWNFISIVLSILQVEQHKNVGCDLIKFFLSASACCPLVVIYSLSCECDAVISWERESVIWMMKCSLQHKHWPDRRRRQNAGLWLVTTGHMTWMLVSDWSVCRQLSADWLSRRQSLIINYWETRGEIILAHLGNCKQHLLLFWNQLIALLQSVVDKMRWRDPIFFAPTVALGVLLFRS